MCSDFQRVQYGKRRGREWLYRSETPQMLSQPGDHGELSGAHHFKSMRYVAVMRRGITFMCSSSVNPQPKPVSVHSGCHNRILSWQQKVLVPEAGRSKANTPAGVVLARTCLWAYEGNLPQVLTQCEDKHIPSNCLTQALLSWPDLLSKGPTSSR